VHYSKMKLMSRKIIITYKKNIILNEIPIQTLKLINSKNALIYANKLGLLGLEKDLITIMTNK